MSFCQIRISHYLIEPSVHSFCLPVTQTVEHGTNNVKNAGSTWWSRNIFYCILVYLILDIIKIFYRIMHIKHSLPHTQVYFCEKCKHVLITHLHLVIPMSYPCHNTNVSLQVYVTKGLFTPVQFMHLFDVIGV